MSHIRNRGLVYVLHSTRPKQVGTVIAVTRSDEASETDIPQIQGYACHTWQFV